MSATGRTRPSGTHQDHRGGFGPRHVARLRCRDGAAPDVVNSGLTEEEHRQLAERPEGGRLVEHFRDLPGVVRLPDVPACVSTRAEQLPRFAYPPRLLGRFHSLSVSQHPRFLGLRPTLILYSFRVSPKLAERASGSAPTPPAWLRQRTCSWRPSQSEAASWPTGSPPAVGVVRETTISNDDQEEDTVHERLGGVPGRQESRPGGRTGPLICRLCLNTPRLISAEIDRRSVPVERRKRARTLAPESNYAWST